MRLFRDIFLCLALLLTLVGNTTTTTACFADGEISFVGNAACAGTRETAHADCRAGTPCAHDANGEGDCRAPHEPLTVALDDDLSASAFPNGVPVPNAFFFAEFFSAFFDAAALRARAFPSTFPPGDDALLALLRAPKRAGALPLLA